MGLTRVVLEWSRRSGTRVESDRKSTAQTITTHNNQTSSKAQQSYATAFWPHFTTFQQWYQVGFNQTGLWR